MSLSSKYNTKYLLSGTRSEARTKGSILLLFFFWSLAAFRFLPTSLVLDVKTGNYITDDARNTVSEIANGTKEQGLNLILKIEKHGSCAGRTSNREEQVVIKL